MRNLIVKSLAIAALFVAMCGEATADLDDQYNLDEKQREAHRSEGEEFRAKALRGEGFRDAAQERPQPPPEDALQPSDMVHTCGACSPCIHPVEVVYSHWAIWVTDDDWSWLDIDDPGAFTNMVNFEAAVGSEDWADARAVDGFWFLMYRAKDAQASCSNLERHNCGNWDAGIFEHWIFGSSGKVSSEASSQRGSSTSTAASASGSVSGGTGQGGSGSGSGEGSWDSETRVSCLRVTKGQFEFFWKRINKATDRYCCECGSQTFKDKTGFPLPDPRKKAESGGAGNEVRIVAAAEADVIESIEGLGGSRYDFCASGDRPVSVQLIGATADYHVDSDAAGVPVAVADAGRKEPIPVVPGHGKDVPVLGRLTDGGPEILVVGFHPTKSGKKRETPSFRGTTKAVPTGPNQGTTPPVVLTGLSPKTGAVPHVEFTARDEKGRKQVAVFLPDVVVTDEDGKQEVGGRILVTDLETWNRAGVKIQVTITDPSTGGKVAEGALGKDVPVEDPETGEDRSVPSTHRAQPKVTVEPTQVKPGMRVTAKAEVSFEDLEALEAAGYPREVLEIRITGPDGKEIARGPVPGPVVGTTRATKPGKYQVRAEIQIVQDPKAWRRALAKTEESGRRLTEALKGLPGFEAYARELLDGKTEALKRLGGAK